LTPEIQGVVVALNAGNADFTNVHVQNLVFYFAAMIGALIISVVLHVVARWSVLSLED
jgi:hypothetical protein